MSDFSMPPPAMGAGAGKPAAFNGSTQVTIPKDVSDSFSVNGVTHKACVPKNIKIIYTFKTKVRDVNFFF